MAIYLMGQGRNLYSSTEEYSASGSFIIPSHGDNFFSTSPVSIRWLRSDRKRTEASFFFLERNYGKILEQFSQMFEETWGIISGDEELGKI